MPYPVSAVPGSIPRTITRAPARSNASDLGEYFRGQIEVGGDALNVIQILERLDEPQILTSDVPIDLDRRLGLHRHLGRLDLYAASLEGQPHLLELGRIDEDLDRIGFG